MNTYISRLCSVAFVVLVLSACGGGGGGSGNSAGGTTSVKTKPTTITVIDGYIKGAIVCVDKNENGACDDGETKETTSADGKVTLNIPEADVGKYPIVAYIPADAIDSDDPKSTVGKAYTMSAPAGQSAIVSPLSTLVKRLVDKGGKNTAEATVQIKLTVGDATINYMESADAKSTRLAAKMLAALMQDPSKLVQQSYGTDVQKQAAMADAMLEVLPYIKSKAQELSASIPACANDIGGAGCQEAVAQALSGVMQTASITGASSSNTSIINSGDRANALAVTLSGTYSGNALGSDYSIRVTDGGSTLGTATLAANTNAKTWSFTTGTLTAGSHDFKAVVVRNSNSGSKLGIASDAYTIKIGNSVSASNGANLLDTITLTLSNLWSNVKSVVFTFSGDSGAVLDGQTSKTLTAPESGLWSSVTTAFKTTGQKIINLVFKDQDGVTLDSTSINLKVATGTVSQTANISSIKNHATPIAAEIPNDTSTRDTQPLISGTSNIDEIDAALRGYYDVVVYDNGTALTGTLTYTDPSNKKNWSFTPSAALTQGEHAFKSAVLRFDGVEGARSITARKAIVLTSSPSYTPSSPNVLDTVSFSVNNLYSGITSVAWDLGDGAGLQTKNVIQGASLITTRYNTPGNKTVTVTYKNGSTVLATDTLPVTVAVGTVSQTAIITGVKSGDLPLRDTLISNGGRTDSLRLILSGTYTGDALGSDYSIRVTDGGTTLGTATLAADTNAKTWSFTTATLTAGSHDFKAVVVRNIDSKLGAASGAYTIKLGNSVGATNSANVLDTITLTLSNLWSNVKSVVFNITDSRPSSLIELSDNNLQSDLVDEQTNKTLTAPDIGLWSSITTAFKTSGNKIINLVFKDQAGSTLDSSNITVKIGSGVSQTASITNVQDDSTGIAATVPEGATTTDTTPVITGTSTIDTASKAYYDVAVYDGVNKLEGNLTYADPNNKKAWTFIPARALTPGSHVFTARVARIDGTPGQASAPRSFSVQTPNPSLNPINPNVLDTVTFSVDGLLSGITSAYWNFGDGFGRSSNVTEGATSVTTSYRAQGPKYVTVSYKNSQGTQVAFASLTFTVGEGTVSQMASITGASSGGTPFSSGDRANALAVTLSGSYSGNALGSDYSIRVTDGGSTLGTATLAADAAVKTWSFTTGTLTAGSHDFKAVVVRNSDSFEGTASSPYTVKIGNSVSASGSGSSNVLDTITLTLSNLWSNVKSVVFTFSGDSGDLVDGQTSKTANAPNSGLWSSITTAFKTTGQKIINLVFKDQDGSTLDSTSINVEVATGTVISQTASITNVQDDRSQPFVSVSEGAITSDTTPVISGTSDINTALKDYYSVAVYDNGAATPLAGAMSYSNGKSQWTFTPAAPLSATTHAFTAKVLRFDGLAGLASSPRAVNIGSANISYSPANPKVRGSVTLTASNLSSDVSTVTWDFGDGKTLLTRPTSGSTSTSNTYTYDGNKAVTLTYKDSNARILGSDNLVLPVAPLTPVAPEISIVAKITSAKNGTNQAIIPNGGRSAVGGTLVLTGVTVQNLESYYTVEVSENGGVSSGSLSLDRSSGRFEFSTSGTYPAGVRNFSVRVVCTSGGCKGAWSDPYKVLVGPDISVNSVTVNAWDDLGLTVNGIAESRKYALITFAETGADMANNTASLNAFIYGRYNSGSFALTTAYKTTGQKNIIVEYKDASGNSLDIDSVSLTVNPAAPITQTAKVTGLAGDLSVSGVTGKFTLNGTLSAPIGQFYSVKVYDNNAANPLPGTITFNAARNGWTFIPDAPLAAGDHDFKAVVVRPGDGATGLIQESSTITVPPSRFSKISSTGQPLSNQTANWSDSGSEAAGTQWDCVLDNTTGLTWENKTSDTTSLRYKRHTYTWFLGDKNGNGSPEGDDSGGSCTGLTAGKCNSEAYVKAVNDARLCGKMGWRIPSMEELKTLQQTGVKKGTSPYFPNIETLKYLDIVPSGFDGFDFADSLEYYYFYLDDTPTYFGPYAMMLVRGDFLRTATIQTIADSGGVISNGGQPAYNSLRLSGSYSDVLGSNFKVALYDGNKRLGLVTTNDANKTWSYQLDNLAVGAHAFKVVVETSDRSAQGTPSDVYAVNANTMANASNLKPSLLESVSFWIANTWDAVKTVVWNFGDGIAEQTANLVNNISTSVDYFFQTVGVQTVSAKLKDSSGQTIGTQSLNINVQLGSVAQTATITNISDDSQVPAQTIASGSSTNNRQPLISIRTSETLNNFYSVKIVDAATNTAITTTTVSTSGNSLTLRPANALANGIYRFKAVVSRFEGTQGTPSAEWKVQIGNYDAGFSNSGVVGANAHIGKVTVQSASLSNVASFECTIQPKPGTYSAPVKITWSKVALNSRNLISNGKADLPVYGLYANYNNTISIKAILNDNSTLNLSPVTISTPVGPSTPFDAMTVLTSRASTGRQLGYDFFLSRGTRWSPIVLDTDGNVRWAYAYADDQVFDGPFIPESSAWYDNGFLVGGRDSLGMARIQLDGSFSFTSIASFTANNIINFHHNMEKGKTGYLALTDTSTGGYESDVIEFNPDTGAVIRTWDLKQILSNHITASSDTVKRLFDAYDWFHVNAAAYDPYDNGLIVSSRENFVIKLDYDTGAIRWIFGDPSKYWYTDFPSLRAKAITLEAGGIYPLGQHAVSIPEAGKLLMFNNRMRSTNQPVGASEVNGDRSLVSYYAIDGVNKTATQIWQFDHPSKVYAGYCSSAYMAADKTMLVLYAATARRFTGVDANKNVVFDYSFAGSDFCTPAFNATPIPFGNLNFSR